jgi:hypothetical protein
MIVVVGRGILGLSVAEFLSRDPHVAIRVLASSQRDSASQAAAANLATKAQVFARDPHFELKLSGKRIYRRWLQQLCSESTQYRNIALNTVYVEGLGRDMFSSPELAEKQWRRVAQVPEEIAQRGLQAQALLRPQTDTIEYGSEAWVDAEFLLRLLEDVCRARGVEFCECDVLQVTDFEAHSAGAQAIVICAGSETLRLLEAWQLNQLPEAFRKSRRWSYGATLSFEAPRLQFPTGVSLFEWVSHAALEKLTFSGASGRYFCSSVSVSCPNSPDANKPGEPDFEKLKQQQIVMKDALDKFFGLKLVDLNHSWRWGTRLGFGHKELVVEAVPHHFSFLAGPVVVASGAHKSGFLFAPLIGSLVRQKLQA